MSVRTDSDGADAAADLAAVCADASAWAATRPDVSALALVGSCARGTAGPASDIDLVLLTVEPSRYVDSDEWLQSLGSVGPVGQRRWGAVTEIRFRLRSGREVDLGVALPAWADVAPLDAGTARVVGDGLAPLYDPEGRLERLRAAVSS